MKIQEVLFRAMARKITWFQAIEILGFTDRHLRRIRERYEEFGYDGLFDRRRGRPSPKRVPLATMKAVLGLYRENYFDLNVSHFHEKLKSEHQIDLSYTWVKAALQGAGLIARAGNEGCIANGGSDVCYQGCYCTSMAAAISGFKTSAGMT